jgi:hypothetical protein
VLAKFDADERPVIDDAVARAADAAETFVSVGPAEAMNRFNRREADSGQPEAESGTRKAASGQREAESGKREAESGKREAGNGQQRETEDN